MVRLFAVLGLIEETKLAAVNSLLVRWGVPTLTIDDIPGGEETGPYVAPELPSGTVAPTLTLLMPNGGEVYEAGSEDMLRIRVRIHGAPKGARLCTTLVRYRDARHFAFPGSDSCTDAVNGTMSIEGALVRTTGYDLGPGDYTLEATLYEPPRADYKDSGRLAKDESDGFITLTGETVAAVETPMLVDNSFTTSREGKNVSVHLLGPTSDETLYIGDVIPARWYVQNAPAHTKSILTLTFVQPVGSGGFVSGGTWGREITNNGEQYYRWTTGESRLDVPGIYELTASIEDCDPRGCNWNLADFTPNVYAQSKTHRFYVLNK